MPELPGEGIVGSSLLVPSSEPRVKVCCIGSKEEADMAIDAGAHAIGLVSAMPSGPGVINEHVISEIIIHVQGRVTTVLLSAHVACADVVGQAQRLGPSVVQLVDAVTPATLDEIREHLPDTLLMPVLRVPEGSALETSQRLAFHSDILRVLDRYIAPP